MGSLIATSARICGTGKEMSREGTLLEVEKSLWSSLRTLYDLPFNCSQTCEYHQLLSCLLCSPRHGLTMCVKVTASTSQYDLYWDLFSSHSSPGK